MQFRAVKIHLFLSTAERTAKIYELFLHVYPDGLHFSFADTTSIVKSGTPVIGLVCTVKILWSFFQTQLNRGHSLRRLVLSHTKFLIMLSCIVTAVFDIYACNAVISHLAHATKHVLKFPSSGASFTFVYAVVVK
jgi:hypothetical protein